MMHWPFQRPAKHQFSDETMHTVRAPADVRLWVAVLVVESIPRPTIVVVVNDKMVDPDSSQRSLFSTPRTPPSVPGCLSFFA
jgi:hypothetical protein